MISLKALFLLSILFFKSVVPFSIGIHAGAIDDTREKISLETEIAFKQGLKEALRAGYEVLKRGGKHLDAVQSALNVLENNPLFDSAKGAKVNQKFECELDSSIMDGQNLKCGAVAAVKRIKNPIDAARMVMEQTRHVLLIGDAADKFAEKKGLTMVPNNYFMTPEMIKEWYDVRMAESLGQRPNKTHEHETCGCVVLDDAGNLAAGTTTGGITNKMSGRVGDSPIIGAGTYANNDACAVSCTGLGENMIRRSVAYDVRAKMVYKNMSLKEAADEVIANLEPLTGGFISVDKDGNFYSPFNSPGLARAYVKDDGNATIILFNETADLTDIYYNLEE